MLRCTRVSVAANALLAENDERSNVCAICLDPYESEASKITLPCGHSFHGQCCANHFWSGRVNCPICRHQPRFEPDDDDQSSFFDDSSDDGWRRSVRERTAMRKRKLAKGRRLAKKDKKLARRFEILRKWNTVSAVNSKIAKELKDKLAPRERALTATLRAVQTRLTDNFDLKHADLIEGEKVARKTARHAHSNARRVRAGLINTITRLEQADE